MDLIVFEIDDSNGRRSLREVTKGQGDSCGSTFLDAQMREYLKDRFYGLGRVSDSAMESMMENFVEAIKVNMGVNVYVYGCVCLHYCRLFS